MNDHYDVLGVETDADRPAIQAAYRRLARLHHPDFGGNQSVMARLNEAWDVLSDPHQRAVYDARMLNSRFKGQAAAAGLTPLAAAAERRRQASDMRTPGGTVLDFGRYAGSSLAELAKIDPDYLEWLSRAPIGRAYRGEIDTVLANRRATAADGSKGGRLRPSRSGF